MLNQVNKKDTADSAIGKQLADLDKKIGSVELEKTEVNKEKQQLSIKITNLKTQLGLVYREESAIEIKVPEIEDQEKKASFLQKKQIEKKRWKVDTERRKVEKMKWQILGEIKKQERQIKEINLKHQEVLEEEERFRREREKIFQKRQREELSQLSEKKRLPELEEAIRKWKERERFQLEESIREWGKKKEPLEKSQPQKKETERERKKKEQEYYRAIFKKALDGYKKGEFSVAKNLLNKIVATEQIKEKKPMGFLARIIRIIRGASLREKARDFLKKIKKQEEETQAKHQKAEELKIKKEKEEAEIARRQKEKVKKREELEKYQEELVKKHKEELKAQEEKTTKQYQGEWEKQKQELLEKQEDFREEKQELRKEAMVEVIRRGQEKELEEQKAKIRERSEQELQRIKKELQEQHVRELKALRVEEIKKIQEGLREKEEELKKQEAETKKIKEMPEETLTEEERTKKKEAILKAEEEIKEKRIMIEEEIKKIEQEEIRRKQLEEKIEIGEPREEIEVKEAETEKRRAWLKEAIKKEKETMAPEEAAREQKEKAASLETLFKEGIFHYKERNLDRAIEIFQELKKDLPEPKKEPGFFSRIFGRIPLYIQVEDYISKIEKEKVLEEKKRVREIKEAARIVSGGKQKERPPSRGKKKISRRLPSSPLAILKKFLFSPPLVAIDISDYSIELLRLNKKFSVLAYGRSIIKEGVIYEGAIKDQKELSLAFKLVVNQAGFKPFRPRQGPILRGIVSVPEYKTNVQTFTFDSRENIFEKVKEEIKKTVPFPIDELYWDYLEVWDEKLKQTKVLSVAVLKNVIDEQIYFLKSSGVDPVVFDFEAASISRALLPEKGESEKISILILDIGARVTNMNIFDETRFINLSTAITSGGHYFVDRIIEYFDVTKEEAETIMNIKGFHKEDNIILGVLEKEMEKIVEETKEAIKHYHNKTGKEIKKIILSGGTALLPEINKFFQGHFQGVEIEIGDPLKKIKRRGGIDPSKAVLYANSLGLALRSIIKDPIGEGINLLPGKIKEKEKKVYWQRHRQKLIIIRIVFAVLIIAAVLLICLYLLDVF